MTHCRTVLRACAMLLCLAGVTQAQEKVVLRPNVTPGMEIAFEQSEDAEMQTSVSAEQQPPQQMQQRINQKSAGKIQILEADNGIATRFRISFDADCGGTLAQMGQTQPLPFPLAGQSVTVSTAGGVFQVDHDGQLDDDTINALRMLTELEPCVLPQQPVGIGDTWNADSMKMAQIIGMNPKTDKIGMMLTLKRLTEVQGRRCAEVEMTGDIAGSKQGLAITRMMKGTAVFDLASGRVLRTELAGNMSINGTQDMQGTQVRINSRGNVRSLMTSTIKGGAMAGPIKPVAPVTPSRDTPQPPGGFVQKTVPDSVWRSDKLSVQFAQNRGTITMGDKQFPATVRSFDGTHIEGSFSSGPNSFDFSAVIDGDTMSFKTGSTEYGLKREGGARNPLDP